MMICRVIADRLREEEVDGEALLSLTQVSTNTKQLLFLKINFWASLSIFHFSLSQNDLTAILDIKLGPAIKIFNAITAVRLQGR